MSNSSASYPVAEFAVVLVTLGTIRCCQNIPLSDESGQEDRNVMNLSVSGTAEGGAGVASGASYRVTFGGEEMVANVARFTAERGWRGRGHPKPPRRG